MYFSLDQSKSWTQCDEVRFGLIPKDVQVSFKKLRFSMMDPAHWFKGEMDTVYYKMDIV